MAEQPLLQDSRQERASLLRSLHNWDVPAYGEVLTRDTLLRRFDTIATVADTEGDASAVYRDELSAAYETSVRFVHEAFDAFEGKSEVEPATWAFAVPARGEEFQDEGYASEVTFFLPLLDPRFGVDAMIRQRSVAHLAPTVIERYRGDAAGHSGALVWTPVYFDPMIRYDKRLALDSVKAAQYRVNEAAHFTRNELGATVMGLGAVLPGLTKFGRSIDVEGLYTTTGHGGTVHLVAETLKAVASDSEKSIAVGAIGLGSIGMQMFKTLHGRDDIANIKTFFVHDLNPALVAEAADVGGEGRPVHAAENAFSLLAQSDLIVTAATTPIDLDALEGVYSQRLDLEGKIIIDDSQPGSFDREQVETRGGSLVWVVGEDTSSQRAFERVAGYQYGDAAGLLGSRAVWGCEAEAGSLALLGRQDLAIRSSVTPEIVRRVGEVCVQAGIRVTSTLQSYGKPVENLR